MRALTIWQPWASLVMIGAKPFEFRRWDYRTRDRALEGQRIVIHAGARQVRPKEIEDLLARIRGGGTTGMRNALALPLLERIASAWKCRGVVELAAGLGTAVLARPRRCTDLFRGVADSDRIDEHMWAWPLTNVEPFEAPIAMRGAQGFWTWPVQSRNAAQKGVETGVESRARKGGLSA